MEATPIENNVANEPAQQKSAARDWMTVLGIVGLLLLVAGSVWALSIGKQFRENPLVNTLAAMTPQIEAMSDMTQSQIEQQAASLSADELLASPAGYEGRYVVVSGVVSEEQSAGVIENLALNSFGHSDFTGMVLNDRIVLIDITGEAGYLPEGTPVRGFGKLLVARTEDLFNIPLVGADLRREFGGAQGIDKEVIFLISRGVQVDEAPEAQVLGSL